MNLISFRFKLWILILIHYHICQRPNNHFSLMHNWVTEPEHLSENNSTHLLMIILFFFRLPLPVLLHTVGFGVVSSALSLSFVNQSMRCQQEDVQVSFIDPTATWCRTNISSQICLTHLYLKIKLPPAKCSSVYCYFTHLLKEESFCHFEVNTLTCEQVGFYFWNNNNSIIIIELTQMRRGNLNLECTLTESEVEYTLWSGCN